MLICFCLNIKSPHSEWNKDDNDENVHDYSDFEELHRDAEYQELVANLGYRSQPKLPPKTITDLIKIKTLKAANPQLSPHPRKTSTLFYFR